MRRQRAEGQLPLGQDAASQDRAGRPGRGPSRGEPGAADGGLRHYDQGADPITTRHWVGGRMRSSSRRLGVAERRAMQLGELRQCWTRTSRQLPGEGGRDPRAAGHGTTAKDSVAGATRPLALSKGSDGFESGPRCGPTVSLAWDGWQLEAGRGGGNRLGVRRVRRGTWLKGSKQRTGVSPQWGRSRSRGPAPADSDRHGPGGSAAARQSQWLEGIGQCQEEDGLMPRLRQAATVVVPRANRPGPRRSGAAGAARPSCQVFLHKHGLSTSVGRRVGRIEPQSDSGLVHQ